MVMVGIAKHHILEPVVKAELTLKAIEDNLAADNCGQYRQNLRDLLPKMEDAYRGEEKPFRSHQGASGIGNKCEREAQLKWLWTTKVKFEPRLLRLFNRGHLEEARFLSLLMCIPGVQLWYETEDGGQIKWSDYSNHYGSALDGVALGIPDVPQGAACYTEFKTASDKKFNEFVKKGCRECNYTYFVQCQQCMHYMKLPFTLFMVVNKNTDELYAEIISYNEQVALKYVEKAGRVIFSTSALPRISDRATFFECRWCDVKQVCHGKEIPEINCRTCYHWSAKPEGGVCCALNHDDVFRDCVYKGCESHMFKPHLLPTYELVEQKAQSIVLRTKRGHVFEHGPEFITSEQLKELGTKYEP